MSWPNGGSSEIQEGAWSSRVLPHAFWAEI